MTTPAHDPAQLLQHMDWIRALARQLVSDRQLADDVAQETWRQASERPPRDARNVRGWLAAVTRHVAINARRGESRRRVHEQRGARPESLPSSAELVAQTELQRDLVGFVLELDEPYRSVIVLRYFRGSTVAEIARAKGIPQATVRSQLARGLERLRERLDRTRGGRESWMQALAPIAGASSSVALKGASSVAGVSVAGVAVLAVVTIGAWMVLGRTNEDGSLSTAAKLAESAPDPAREPARAPMGERAKLSTLAVDASRRATVVASARTTELGTLHIRVVDAQTREPVPQLEYALFAERGGNKLYQSGRTDDEGRATCTELPENTLLVETEWRAPWAKGFGGLWLEKGATRTLEIALEHGASAIGRVVDDTGAVVAGAQIGLATRAASGRYVGVDRSWTAVATSDEHGRFRVGGLSAQLSGVWIVDRKLRPERVNSTWLAVADARFEFQGAVTREIDVAKQSAGRPQGADIELGDVVIPRSATISGRVVDEHDAPIPSAWIARNPSAVLEFDPTASKRALTRPGDPEFELHACETISGADGRFELAVPSGEGGLMVRTREGAGSYERLPPLAPAGALRDVVVRIALEEIVRLRVLDENGNPLDVAVVNPSAAGLDFNSGRVVSGSARGIGARAHFSDGSKRDISLLRDADGLARWPLGRPRTQLRALDVGVAGCREQRVEVQDASQVIEVRLSALPRVRVSWRWADGGAAFEKVHLRGLSFRACLLGKEALGRASFGCGLGSTAWIALDAKSGELQLPVRSDDPFYVHVNGADLFHELAPQTFGPFAPSRPGETAHEIVIEPKFETIAEVPREPPAEPQAEPPRAHLSLEPLDARTGAALAADVVVSDASGRDSFPIGYGVDSTGLRAVPPGRYDVLVSANGYRAREWKGKQFVSGQTLALGRVELEALPRLRVRLVDAAGAPWSPRGSVSANVNGRGSNVKDGRAEFPLELDAIASAHTIVLVTRGGCFAAEGGDAERISVWYLPLPRGAADEERVVTVPEPRELRIHVLGLPASHASCAMHLGVEIPRDVPSVEWHTLVSGEELESKLASERLFRFTLGPGRYRLRTACPLHPTDDQIIEVVEGEGAQQLDLVAH